MKCRFEHDGDCCNSGATQYMCKCKKPCDTIIPLTNADRIRAMTDEELAELIVKQLPMYLWPNGVRTIYFDMDNHNKDNAVKAWLKWLQQPAEGD